jgi:hypothetical protein
MRVTLALSALLALSLTQSALQAAQSPVARESSGAAGVPPIEGPSSNGPGSDDRAARAPVLHITSVEVMRSTHGPALDVIRVRGLASTSGWQEAELVPLTRSLPADGILELIFVARAPAEAAEADGFEAIEAIFPLETNHPFKGVNVHSASEAVFVAALPGYTEGKSAGEDCNKCVGKTFVAKGASAPSGHAASELVHEERLGAPVRVIRSNEGFASADSNPNRLTLILNKDGKITTAVWE